MGGKNPKQPTVNSLFGWDGFSIPTQTQAHQIHQLSKGSGSGKGFVCVSFPVGICALCWQLQGGKEGFGGCSTMAHTRAGRGDPPVWLGDQQDGNTGGPGFPIPMHRCSRQGAVLGNMSLAITFAVLTKKEH